MSGSADRAPENIEPGYSGRELSSLHGQLQAPMGALKHHGRPKKELGAHGEKDRLWAVGIF